MFLTLWSFPFDPSPLSPHIYIFKNLPFSWFTNPRHHKFPKSSLVPFCLSFIFPFSHFYGTGRPVADHPRPVADTVVLAISSIFFHLHSSSHKTSFIKHPLHTLHYIHKHFSFPFHHPHSFSHWISSRPQGKGSLVQERAREDQRSKEEGIETSWWQQGAAGHPSWALLYPYLLSFAFMLPRIEDLMYSMMYCE